MKNKVGLTAVCTFVFGMGFALTSVAFAHCRIDCLENCKQREIEKCLADGGGDQCYREDYLQCYPPCDCLPP